MNKETYEALKSLLSHCENGGSCNNEFWQNLEAVKGWAKEVAKDYKHD